MTEFHHTSVFHKEAVELLLVRPDGWYVDCTLGGAGHTRQLLDQSSPNGQVIAFDQDETAIANARQLLREYGDRIHLIHDNFQALRFHMEAMQVEVDGVLFDLGVSSPQLDVGERGFSYQHDAPLDMRMDRRNPLSAYTIVNEWPKEEITRIIREFGEENWAARIGEFIVEKRQAAPIETTWQLVDVIKAAIPARARREGPHPAKRTFQAIRIAVNDELGVFERTLRDALDLVTQGGRVAVITFHSLEDRICKQVMQEYAKGCICPPQFPICKCGQTPRVKLVTRKPVLPTQAELDQNPRARSAKLRVAEKL
ncbi:16S rRNA (cytosine(1402)-N(4))-methyltransferase RsmH [Fodinisporobacter ferrooxydans]|uniref:Ribosomal RNA small subunit methyltransferase H n=1 Tax=Fodinisporobacter ferrooxydans TaxID=2901836 RepID=A0ABY4CJ06_9BACL|nr:16S rRNA (cytosine(1402)-N(4))-methyltransferase RsmH [Alicyclobacillaceae bacterium MYW30-H2]